MISPLSARIRIRASAANFLRGCLMLTIGCITWKKFSVGSLSAILPSRRFSFRYWVRLSGVSSAIVTAPLRLRAHADSVKKTDPEK